MSEQFGGAQNLGIVELRERRTRERDLGHLEAGKMRTDLRQAGKHGGGHRLEDGIRRGGEHPEENTLGHCAGRRRSSVVGYSAARSSSGTSMKPGVWPKS